MKDVMIQGRWDSTKCATCGHKWGNHAARAPHKCTRRNLGCECPEFKEPDAGAMNNGGASETAAGSAQH